MKTANEIGLGSTVGAETELATIPPVCVSDTPKQQTAVCAYEFDPLHDPRWAAFVDSHPRASVFHGPNWLRALRTVYGYEPVVVTSCSPGSRLTNGLVFCRINSPLTGRRFVSLPFSDHCEPLIDRSDALHEVLLHLKRYVDEDRWKYFEIRPFSYEVGNHIELGRSATFCFHRLDLRPSIQELFRNFHKDCVQRKIRRAERENLKYEDGNSEDLLQKFYRLLVSTRRRQFLPPQPIEWFRGLIAAFGKDLKIRVASKEGVAVSSILTLSHKKSMVYKYGCSDAESNRFGGTALLFWKTIQEAKDGGFEEFDLGRSRPNLLGLIAFKEHWGAQGALLQYWTYPHRPDRPTARWKKSLARRVVSAAPDLALIAVGKLLYRHIG